jgi:hypothetical protein
LQISVSNSFPNISVIIQGFSSQYVITQPLNSYVNIICSKNGGITGTIFVVVNTYQVTTPPLCNTYTNIGNPGDCQSEIFNYDLSLLSSYTNYYQFDCGLFENPSIRAPTLILQRLCKMMLNCFSNLTILTFI